MTSAYVLPFSGKPFQEGLGGRTLVCECSEVLVTVPLGPGFLDTHCNFESFGSGGAPVPPAD